MIRKIVKKIRLNKILWFILYYFIECVFDKVCKILLFLNKFYFEIYFCYKKKRKVKIDYSKKIFLLINMLKFCDL